MTDKRFMPKKERRPRAELREAVEQIQTFGYTVAGSYRREKPDVGDLDILIPYIMDFGEAIELVTDLFDYEEIQGQGMKSAGLCQYHGSPLLLNLWRVPKASAWAGMLLFATGPYDLNIAMRARAKGKSLTLSQYGLFAGGEQLDRGDIEEDIFEHLRMPFLTPVERNDWQGRLFKQSVTEVVQVPSSNGVTFYDVTIKDGEAQDCECTGFAYRSKCRHLQEAEAIYRTKSTEENS